MAMVASAIAHDGKIMSPYVVQKVRAKDQSELYSASPKEFAEPMTGDQAGQLEDMMRAVVAEGTAKNLQGMRIAGKTGTAEQGPGNPNANWFVGFSPADKPRYAFAVMTEAPGPGSNAARSPGRSWRRRYCRSDSGLVLNDRYRLLERLAIGGMGEVWRAVDAVSGLPVAVKLLRRELGSDMRARGRFESEARFAAELRHPGIARAFDYGEHGGRSFLVMELVPGEPLDEILARDGGLPLEAVLDLLVQAGRALTVAHGRPVIVHRDVK